VKCPYCGNTEFFIVINHEQFDAQWQKTKNSFLLTNQKTLSADFYCASEQCKNKPMKLIIEESTTDEKK
jgi:hypothetical protein